MNATGLLFVLIGLFVIFNAPNLVGVFKGEKTFSATGVKAGADTAVKGQGSRTPLKV